MCGLYYACQEGHISVVKYLQKQQEDEKKKVPQTINKLSTDEKKWPVTWNTICQYGCEFGKPEIVKASIAEKCEINAACYKKAFQNGNINVINMIIENEIKYFDAAFEGACAGGHIHLIELLVSKSPQNWKSTFADQWNGYRGVTAWNRGLLAACSKNKTKVVQLILDKIQKNKSYDIMFTECLLESCYYGHIETVKLLFEKAKEFNFVISDSILRKLLFNSQLGKNKEVEEFISCQMYGH